MKKIVLSTLCIATFFSSTYAMDEEKTPLLSQNEKREMDEESWDKKTAEFHQATPWKKRGKLAILGFLTFAAALNGITMAESIHGGNSSITALPYNATLLSSNETCSFQYGTPCYETPYDENNYNDCCSAAENLKECNEWCKKDSNKKNGCMILRKCKNKTTYDPQFVGSAAALLLTLSAEFGLIFWFA